MEDKTIYLLVLGIVAVIAAVGLIMMFSEMSKSGAFISAPKFNIPKITIPQTQCPVGTNSYDYMTAQSLMQRGVAKCNNVGVKWCCVKLPPSTKTINPGKLPIDTTTINSR